MASTYSTNLAIELIGTGDQAGSWGNTTNTNLGTLIEQAISGYVTQAVSTGTDTTITIPNGATGVARNMYIELTGTGGASTNLIVPANKKLYFIFNNTSSGQVTVKVSGQTGVSVPNGKKMVLVSNGTDVVVAENYIADFGSNSATITNLTCTSLTLSNNPTLSGGTANGVLYLNGSKVATSGSALTFDGTSVTFGSTAQRIIADMSNATSTSRLLFQTSTTNGNSSVGVIPNGTSAVGQFICYNSADANNASTAQLIATSTVVRVQSGQTGTGSYIPLTFYTSGTEVARLDTSGTFRVKGAGTAGSTDAVQFDGAAPASTLILNSSGNLGIGTASPVQKLDVRSGATADAVGITSTSTTAYSPTTSGVVTNCRLQLFGGGATNSYTAIRFSHSGSFENFFGAVQNSGGVGEFVSGGYNGSSYFEWTRLASNSSGDTSLTVKNGTVEAFITANSTGGTNYAGVVGTSTNHDLVFRTNGIGRARIDTSGNLGLGVTPTANQFAGYKTFQIASQGVISSDSTSNGELEINNNAYRAVTTATLTYINSFAATKYAQYRGEHRWFYNSNTPSAGNAISFTQAMTLDASGNLLVGTTSSTGISGAAFKKGAATGCLLEISANNGTPATDSLSVGQGGDNTAYVFQRSNQPLVFGTNNTERGRFTAGGYFKASDNGTYRGSGSTYHEFNQSINGDVLVVNATSTSYASNALAVTATRNTTNNSFYAIAYYNDGAAAYKFQVADSGNVTNTNGSYGTISDVKMKTDIVDAGSQWADMKAVRFRKFKMKNDPSGLMQLGVVAQELEQTSPGLVDEHADRDAEGNDLGTTTKSVKTSVLLMKAAVALQEAMARIESLEADVAALKGAK